MEEQFMNAILNQDLILADWVLYVSPQCRKITYNDIISLCKKDLIKSVVYVMERLAYSIVKTDHQFIIDYLLKYNRLTLAYHIFEVCFSSNFKRFGMIIFNMAIKSKNNKIVRRFLKYDSKLWVHLKNKMEHDYNYSFEIGCFVKPMYHACTLNCMSCNSGTKYKTECSHALCIDCINKNHVDICLVCKKQYLKFYYKYV